MTTDFTELKAYCQALHTRHALRDAMFEEFRQMLHMEWGEVPSGDWIKATMSPDAFNAIVGAVRLLTSTDPQIAVPFDETEPAARQASDRLERAARAMWTASGRVKGRAVHYDLLFSAILFGEVCASVTKTSDLLEIAEATGNKGQVARLKHIVKETPYLFDVWNPATCYPDRDSLGLRGVLRRQQVRWGDVLETWGELAEAVRPSGGRLIDRDLLVVINDWYDWEQRAVWLDEANDPIYHEDHDLGFLPVVSNITEGTGIFDEPERQRFPMLYAVWKSGLWKRQNLSLTLMYSLIFGIGSNPLLKRMGVQDGDDALLIDRSIVGGVVNVPPGQDLQPLAERVIDPSQTYGADQASRLFEESTIPKQALGAPPSQQMPFSAISLLNQSGRLPLMGAKMVGGQTIAGLLTIALQWLRADGGRAEVYEYGKKGGGVLALTAKDIPERLVLEVNLEVDLPTDKLQLANTGMMMKNAKLASRRWIQEEILGIGQPDAMTKEIWMEERMDLETQMRLAAAQQMLAAKMQAQQAGLAAQQAGPGQAPPPPGGPPMAGGGEPPMPPPEMGGPGMSAEMATPYPPGGVGPGAPLAGPLPPMGAAPMGAGGGG